METNFGEYIRKLRTKSNLTLIQLGAKLGIDSGALSKIETGKKEFDERCLGKLVDTFELDIDKLKSEYFGDQFAKKMYQYNCSPETLIVAKEKMNYLKEINVKQGEINLKMENKPTVIDLFYGCGGLSYGFIDAGYEALLGIDHWKDAIATFESTHKNAKGIVSDLFKETPKDISIQTRIKEVDVIIGGPPCQGFSIAGKRIVDDERNQLYKSFVNFVDFYKPKVFVMENVPNIISMGKGVVKTV